MARKTAFVTGGASGIGRAVAEMLANRGIRVAILDLNISAAQSVAGSLLGDDHIAVSADVADWESQLSAFEHVLAEFGGRIDYVFGIAGIEERTLTANDPEARNSVKPDLATLYLDLYGVLRTASLTTRQMRQHKPDANEFRRKRRFSRANL